MKNILKYVAVMLLVVIGSGVAVANVYIDGTNNGVNLGNLYKIFLLPAFNHPTIQSQTINGATRLYLTPNGTVTAGLQSGIKMFGSDYNKDSINYCDFGMWATNDTFNYINVKQNGAGCSGTGKDIMITTQDTTYLMRIPLTVQSNANSTGVYVNESGYERRLATVNMLEWRAKTNINGTWSQASSAAQSDYDPNLVGEIPGYIHNSVSNANYDNITWHNIRRTRGNYILSVGYVTANSGAIVDFYYNGTKLTTIDQYSASTANNQNVTVGFTLNTYVNGDFSVRVNGKNGASSSYVARISRIEIIKTG